MENLNNDEIRVNLLKRSTAVLEHTKLNFKDYQSARLILLAFTQDPSVDYQLWENLIRVFENIIALEEKLNIKEEDKITRTVDELGRIVLPIEIRKSLRNP